MSFLNRSTISHKALELSAFEDSEGAGLIKPLIAHQSRNFVTNSGGNAPITTSTFEMNLTPDFAGTTGILELTRNLEPTTTPWYVGNVYSNFSIIATLRTNDTNYVALDSPAYYHRIIGGITDYSSNDNTPIISWTEGAGDIFITTSTTDILASSSTALIEQVQTIATLDSKYFYRITLNGVKGALGFTSYIWKVTFKLF